MTMESSPPSRADEIGLLDLVVTVTESWKLLVLGSLGVAIVVFALLSFLPEEFEASAVVQLTADQVAQVQKPETMDALLATSGRTPTDETTRRIAREGLLRRIGMSAWNQGTKDVTLTVSGATAGSAEALLEALINRVRSSDAATTTQEDSALWQIELNTLREYNESLREGLAALGAKLGSSGNSADSPPVDPESYARAISFLANQIREGEVRIANVEQPLVESAPSAVTQVRRISSKPETTAMLSFTATFILLLIFVFARDAIRTEMRNPQSAGKVERIRNAIWGSRRAKN
jgi:hypothetical protein